MTLLERDHGRGSDAGWSDYKDRFAAGRDAEDYARLYDKGSYDDYVWSLEEPAVVAALRRERERTGRLRLLDFACGTGRILRAADPVADELTGLDISAEMARRAAAASPKSQILVGDLLADRLLTGTYDAVTAFRFFLNAPRELRLPVLRKLREHVEPGALLVLNNHGHAPSLRSLAVRTPAARRVRPNELRHRDIRELLAASGFRIERRQGFSAFPAGVHRRLPAAAVRAADAAAGARPVRAVAGRLLIEQLYLARAV